MCFGGLHSVAGPGSVPEGSFAKERQDHNGLTVYWRDCAWSDGIIACYGGKF